MIELQFLNKLLLLASMSLAVDNDINSDYFTDYKDEFEFIIDHYTEYGNVPDDLTMADEFKGFEFLDVRESDKYLVDKMREQNVYNSAVPILNETAKIMQEDSVRAVEYMMPKIRDLLNDKIVTTDTNIMDDIDDTLEWYDKLSSTEGLIGISTGDSMLDEILGGFLPGEELVTIVGRPNIGKSYLLDFFAAQAWLDKKSVLLYSGEMSKKRVKSRIDSIITHVSNSRLNSGKLNDDEYELWTDHLTTASISGVPIHVITPKDLDNKYLTPSKLDSLIEKYDSDVVFIDQLSLCEPDSYVRGQPTRLTYAEISKAFFLLSEKHEVPIIQAAQAGRKAEERTSKLPELEDIAESDAVAQESSRVLAIAQDGDYFLIAIKKNRHGEKDLFIEYIFDKDSGTLAKVGMRTMSDDDSEQGVRADSVRAKNRRDVERIKDANRERVDSF